MATTCPIGFDAQRLRDAVKRSLQPRRHRSGDSFHFNIGADYAVNLLRYEREELDALPKRATARFAGVGNPHRVAAIEPGETVVDEQTSVREKEVILN